MKRKFLFTLIFVVLCALFTLVGCDSEGTVKVDSIRIKEGTSFEIALGKFDCSDYTIVAVNGETETEYPMTIDMLSASEAVKFYRVGKHTVAINAFNKTCNINIEVFENQFEGVELVGIDTVYDGEPHYLTVKGNIPQNTKIIYPEGNNFTEVCNNTVSAILTCPDYKTITLTATVTIRLAKYDMSGVAFPDKTFVYDGTEKSICIEGELPKGVSVSYRINNQNINSQILANEKGYKVEAVFKSANVNYEPIESKFATLIIKKADFDISKVVLEDKTEDYASEPYDVYFDKDDKLPKGCILNDIKARYTDKDGKVCVIESESKHIRGASRKVLSLLNAYEYTIEHYFIPLDSVNYNAPEIITSKFTINKIKYDYPDLDLITDAFEYDGTEKSLEVVGTFGEELHIEYENNCQKNVGEYEVKAHFTVYDGVNYIAPESLTATMYIVKARFNFDASSVSYEDSFSYTGSTIIPEIQTEIPEDLKLSKKVYEISADGEGGIIETPIDEPKEIGTYKLVLTVAGDAINNYYEVEDLNLTYNITKCVFNLSGLSFINEFDYDGTLHVPQVLNLPEGLKVSFDKQAKDVKDGKVETVATFEMTDKSYQEHYVLPMPVKTYVKINPIRYKSYYKFDIADKHVTYDNNFHSIEGTVIGDYVSSNDLKNNVNVTYTLQKKGLDRIIEGNGTSEVGEYTVTAHIELKNDKNFYFDDYTATLIIDRGNIKASDIEKAIVIKQESGKSYVVLDETILGDIDYVLDDFVGYFEYSSGGIAGTPTEESKGYYFGTHDIYLKFNESSLYSIVDDLGNVLQTFTPYKRLELASEVNFYSFFTLYIHNVYYYDFMEGGAIYPKTICTVSENRLFRLVSNAQKWCNPELKVYSAKLTKKDNKDIFYELIAETEAVDTGSYDRYYFTVPQGVSSLGEYALTFDMDFVDEEYNGGKVKINNIPSYTLNITSATEDEYFEVVDDYLNGKALFLLQNGLSKMHQESGYVSGTSDFLYEDGAKVSIEPDILSSDGGYFDSEHVVGVKFDYSKLYYRYKLVQENTYGDIQTVAGKEFKPSKEGYYRIYFVPDIYAEITNDTSVFGANRGDAWASNSDCWAKVPSIEIYVRTETHAYLTDSEIGEITFSSSYINNSYYNFAKFKKEMQEYNVNNPYCVSRFNSPEKISDLKNTLLTVLFQKLPDYITLEIKNIPSEYSVWTESRKISTVNDHTDMYQYIEYKKYSFTLIVTLDKGTGAERQLYNSTIHMKDYDKFNSYTEYVYH